MSASRELPGKLTPFIWLFLDGGEPAIQTPVTAGNAALAGPAPDVIQGADLKTQKFS